MSRPWGGLFSLEGRIQFFFLRADSDQISTPGAHGIPNARTGHTKRNSPALTLYGAPRSGDNGPVIVDNRKRARVREAVGLVLIGLLILIIAIVRYHRVVDWHVR